MKALKNRKSVGIDDIPAELITAGGEHMANALTTICNKIWMTKKWLTPWKQSLVITIPKKGDFQQQVHAESPA